jgi:ABC-type multidrug transport system ATPase subunit
MKIKLENIGRRFNREWIFRKINYTFHQGESYAILGANGSGKSTLLSVIAGSLTPSEGNLLYEAAGKKIEVEDVFQKLSLAAPYLELIEEFTLTEIISFHFQFKSYLPGLTASGLISLLGLEKSKNKPIKFFSSGMKQRTKLALAFCSDTPVLLLDEPTSNLDQKGVEWYYSLIKDFAKDRLLIICSNQEHEYHFCQHQIQVMDYK